MNGEAVSNMKLCSLPISGDLIFGLDLNSVLERTEDKNKLFPDVKKKSAGKQFFQGPKEKTNNGSARKVGGKGVSYLTLLQPPTNPKLLAACGEREIGGVPPAMARFGVQSFCPVSDRKRIWSQSLFPPSLKIYEFMISDLLKDYTKARALTMLIRDLRDQKC